MEGEIDLQRHLRKEEQAVIMGSYGSLFTVMLLDINKGVELLIYTLKHHLLVSIRDMSQGQAPPF